MAPFEDACLTLEYRLWEEVGDELTDAVVKAGTNVSKQQIDLCETEEAAIANAAQGAGSRLPSKPPPKKKNFSP